MALTEFPAQYNSKDAVDTPEDGYILDVLWCQPIKLIHVVSTSEFHDGTTLILFFLSPPFSAGPQKPRTTTASKIKY